MCLRNSKPAALRKSLAGVLAFFLDPTVSVFVSKSEVPFYAGEAPGFRGCDEESGDLEYLYQANN